MGRHEAVRRIPQIILTCVILKPYPKNRDLRISKIWASGEIMILQSLCHMPQERPLCALDFEHRPDEWIFFSWVGLGLQETPKLQNPAFINPMILYATVPYYKGPYVAMIDLAPQRHLSNFGSGPALTVKGLQHVEPSASLLPSASSLADSIRQFTKHPSLRFVGSIGLEPRCQF